MARLTISASSHFSVSPHLPFVGIISPQSAEVSSGDFLYRFFIVCLPLFNNKSNLPKLHAGILFSSLVVFAFRPLNCLTTFPAFNSSVLDFKPNTFPKKKRYKTKTSHQNTRYKKSNDPQTSQKKSAQLINGA